jgi:hypothetical protein
MAVLSMMALFAAVAGLRRSGLGVIRDRPWLMGLSASVIVSGMGRASVGGAVNNLMPVYALLCLAPAILIREFHAHTPLDNEQVGADGSVTHRSFISRLSPLGGRSGPTLVAAAIVIQFILGAYNPLRFIPTSEMRQGGDRLIERIKSINGEVFVMMHPYYALLAGKRPSAQIAVVWYARERGSSPLPQDLVDRFQRRYYAAIISDETLFELDPPLRQLVEANYMRQEDLTMLDVPPTLTGMFARPTVVYVPKR